MPASVLRDSGSGIWTIRLSGVVTPDEILGAYRQMRESPDFSPESPRLWDAREANAAPVVRALDLRRIASESGSGVRHRVAVLVDRDVDYGITREFQAYAEEHRQTAVTRIFRTLDEALAWLQEVPPPER